MITARIIRLTAIAAEKSSGPRQGFTLLETLMLLIVYISGLLLIAQYVEQNVDERSATAAVQQLQAVSHQAQQLVSEQWPLILQQLEEQGPLSYPCFYKLPDKLLQANKKNTNPYQQSYRISLLHEAADRWQLWVNTQNGRPIPKRAWSRISTPLGFLSGYTTTNEKKSLVIHGQQNLWSLEWPTELKSPGEGHLVTRHDLNQLALTSADCLLYRKAIKGTPQLNQMQTSLDLQKHQIIFSQGSAVGPKQWLLKNAKSSLRATLDHLASSPSITLTDPGDHQVIIDPTAIGTSPSNSQLYRFWTQLPSHTPTTNDPQSFADQLCRDQSTALSALGGLFIVEPTDKSRHLLFICGKGNENLSTSVKAYLWEQLDDGHQPEPIEHSIRPSFIIELPANLPDIKPPAKLSDKDQKQVESFHKFLKEYVERIFYHFSAVEVYIKLKKTGVKDIKDDSQRHKGVIEKNIENELLKKFSGNLKNPRNSEASKVNDTINKLLKLYPFGYLKEHPYLTKSVNEEITNSTHKGSLYYFLAVLLRTNKEPDYQYFINEYNKKDQFKTLLKNLKEFNRIQFRVQDDSDEIKFIEPLDFNNKDSKHINKENEQIVKLIEISFEGSTEFPDIIKYPIGIHLKKSITEQQARHAREFSLAATKCISKLFDNDEYFTDLHNKIVTTPNSPEESEFISSLESFKEFFDEKHKNIFSPKQKDLVQWGVIDLVRHLPEPSPLQLKFRVDKTSSGGE